MTASPASEQAKVSFSDPENPILRALALTNEELAAVQVQVAPLQRGCLRQSKTGVKHQRQHESIALSGRIPWVRLLEECSLLLGCQYFRKFARTPVACLHTQSLSKAEQLSEAQQCFRLVGIDTEPIPGDEPVLTFKADGLRLAVLGKITANPDGRTACTKENLVL